MLLSLLLSNAFAQSAPQQPQLNAQNYTPPVDSEMTMWANDASLKPDGYFGARLWGQYVSRPLVYQWEDETREADVLVKSLLQLNAVGSISFKRIRLGLDVPLYLTASGSQVNTGTGLGDLGVDLKGTLLDTDDNPLGLALGARFNLPTATVDAPLGSPGLGGELQVMADKRLGDLLLVANLGTRFGPEIVLENVTLNDQFLWRAGAGYAVTDAFGLSLDLAGQSNYSAPLSNPASSPIEAMLGGWGRVGKMVLRTGLSTGLTAGVGAPTFRGVLGLAYEPEADKDTDADGIIDRLDRCPNDPEDRDNWQDDDGCPDPSTKVLFRIVDEDGYAVEGTTSTLSGPGIEPLAKDGSFETALHPGGYKLNVTANGYSEVSMDVNVPQTSTHEVVITLKAIPGTLVIKTNGPDGKAIASQWSLGGPYNDAPRGLTETEVKPGKYFLRVQSEGYQIERIPFEIAPGERKEIQLTLTPSKIVVTKEKIELREEVYFDTGKATIKPESFNMLNEVAGILKDNPDITLVSVEGHTDSRGSDLANQKLSEARAASVRQYLIDKGVEANRLTSVGYGESKPLVKGNNEAAWSKNRRVDILIKERK